LREQERYARRRYQAAIAAALETLRYAEQHFAEASCAIDAHIQMARAAVADRTIRSPVQANGTGREGELTAASATAPIRSHAGRSNVSPVPSGSASMSAATADFPRPRSVLVPIRRRRGVKDDGVFAAAEEAFHAR